MRDPKRIDVILQEISNIWHKYPDMRLGQLIGNVLEGAALYYVEDDGLVNALKGIYEGEKEKVQFSLDGQVWDIIKKYPEELGFVLQAKDYQDYIVRYEAVSENTAKDAELTEAEFSTIKAYFETKE